jgi:hypothetical protein
MRQLNIMNSVENDMGYVATSQLYTVTYVATSQLYTVTEFDSTN